MSLINLPKIKPNFVYDFVNQKIFNPNLVYQCAGPITYFDNAGVLRTAPPNTPFTDHDPETGEPLGLRTWLQSTNLALNSETYSVSGSRSSSVGSKGPHGNYTRIEYVSEALSSFNGFLPSPAGVATGDVVTFTLFVGPNSYGYVCFNIGDGNRINIDIQNKSVTAGSVIKHEVLSVLGGHLVSVTAVVGGDPRIGFYFRKNSGNTAYNENNLVGDYFEIGPRQAELGSVRTPYIKTEDSQVTRPAVYAHQIMDETFNKDEGTFIVDVDTEKLFYAENIHPSSTISGFLSFGTNTASNGTTYLGTSGRMTESVRNLRVAGYGTPAPTVFNIAELKQYLLDNPNVLNRKFSKIGISWNNKTMTVVGALNGTGNQGTITNPWMNVGDVLILNRLRRQGEAGYSYQDWNFRSIVHYNKALSLAELETMTR